MSERGKMEKLLKIEKITEPKVIDILGIKYEVEEVECVSKDELRKGQINFLTNKILIDNTMTDQNKNITLIHEIIHGVSEALGMSDLCENESRVQALATALYYVATHNKIIFS